ncbi:death-associated inhibitor of apoptosis 1 [Drosophila ficusphila]|uniref:death-associated inhibitor of apoptosis 1 n=1 Tax=Drosophila ficusphila TaxID=30025 RepID=UPI0007E79CF3|nr:death-associated inhibitor of apoptosis 1 [Drosophila ficusphila]XP_017043253.1 death-associated inhibitor of apoptosis 1 [Drosophila ficusphila]XP_017043254.1 death-associated inhibitor of apoptosis 1 [Drosophila ficusphila]XP_017043255.1 death-associated inhibitor of apoptosis 1 [Drosophila ficusphila]
MANVVTNLRYIYGPAAHELTAAAAVLDQVDNNTNASQLYKYNIYNSDNMNELNREEARLKTFINWPLEWLDKRQLAQTGMYYTNVDDKVKCYFCGVEIGRWEQEDQPVPEHQRWSPNCPLLRRRTTNNVPVNVEALDRILPPISYDICGANDATTTGVELREHAYAEGRIPMSQLIQSIGVNTANAAATVAGIANPPPMSSIATQASTVATQANGDVQPESCRTQVGSGNYFPEYPEYAVESARLRTFEAWPRNLKQKPHQLAEAGFFYTGVGDRVRCFSCGGGLKDWDDNDEPWEQHALWLSQCRFVKLMKGQLYIDTVAAKPELAAADEKEEESSELASSNHHQQQEETSSAGQEEASSASGDVAPSSVAPTAACRIYEKIQEATAAAVAPSASNSGSSTSSLASSIPEEKLCKICYGAEYNTAFLPCGHVVACAKCASSVTKCPLCRKPFTDVMRVYFS